MTLASGPEPLPKRVVLLFSGGLDSSTALYLLEELGWTVFPLFCDYGQRHGDAERRAAVAVRRGRLMYQVKFRLPWGDNALTGVQKLEQAGVNPGNTVVPGRNLILLSLANAVAESERCDAVAIGCNADDAAVYPDCRPGFLGAAATALNMGSGRKLLTPLIEKTKTAVVKEALRLGVPIDRTWSCYAGGIAQCGQCDACIRRANACDENGVDAFRVRLGGDDAAVGGTGLAQAVGVGQRGLPGLGEDGEGDEEADGGE